MQNKLLTVLMGSALIACGAHAQDTGASAAQTSAPTVQQPSPVSQAAQALPAPNQIIYAPRLPNPSELTSAAAAQGLAVDQISQTANQVTVVYRYSNGQTNTVAYQLLPTATAPTTTVVAPSPAPTVVYQTTPQVIYETSPRVIYYDRYDPWPNYYYPPVSLNLGFGYYRGWGGGWHGGGHYGHHWR